MDIMQLIFYQPILTVFNDVNEVLIFGNCRAEFEKSKVSTKIHKQFGYASIENMRRLLNDASLLNSETSKLIEKVYNSCKTSSHCINQLLV